MSKQLTTEVRLSSVDNIKEEIGKMREALMVFLPTEESQRQFTETLFHIVRNNAELQVCSASSLINKALDVAALGLDPHPSAKDVYFFAQAGKNGAPAECVTMYGQGAFVKPLVRSGYISDLVVRTVYEGEPFSITDVSSKNIPGNKETTYLIEHTPTIGDGKAIGVYVRFIHSDGTITTEFFPQAKLHKIRIGAGKGASQSPMWANYEWTGYEKIALKQACKHRLLAVIKDENIRRIIHEDNEMEARMIEDAEAREVRGSYPAQEAGKIEAAPAALEISGPPPSPKKDMNASADAEMKLNARNAFITDAANGKHAYVDMAELDAAIEAATTRGELVKALNALKKPAQ